MSRMPTPAKGSSSERKFGNRPSENCNSCSIILPKYRPRKVSAVRDFPPGCGRLAPAADNTQTKDTVSDGNLNVAAQNSDVLFGNFEKDLKNVLENVKLKDSSHGLDNGESTDTKMRLEHKSSEKVKDLEMDLVHPMKRENDKEEENLLVTGLKDEKTIPTRDLSLCQPPGFAIKFPPRRGVSAIRDFPPGCGRNALCSKENGLNSIGPLTEKGRNVQANYERISSKEIGKQDQHEIESNLNLSDQKSRKVSEKSKGDISKEVVNKNEGNRGKRKFTCYETGDVGLELSDRVIVQALMAPPNCPLKQGRGAFKSNQPGSESKEKKHKLTEKGKSYSRKGKVGVEDSGKFLASANSEENITEKSPVNKPVLNEEDSSEHDKENEGKGKDEKHEIVEKEKHKSVSGKKKEKAAKSGRKIAKKSHPAAIKLFRNGSPLSREAVLRDDVDSSDNGEENEDFRIALRSNNLTVSLPPFPSTSNGDDCDGVVTRNKVRETLRLFQAVCRKLLQGEEAKLQSKGNNNNTLKRIDLAAAKILKDRGKYVNTGKPIIGVVPGVEVGDEFHYRVELVVVGLHRLFQGGIDYVKRGDKILAASIVATGAYANDLDHSDVLIYSGQGGLATSGDKQPEDQKLERGNLALKNSMEMKNYVRVIRGFKETKPTENSDSRAKLVATYIYDGLYVVEKYWQEMGKLEKLIFKFKLTRVPGQPELALKEVKKSKKSKVREGLVVEDITQKKLSTPICAVNTVDNERPPEFEYTTKMRYPECYKLTPPKGCECTDGCSDSEKCLCAVKNGGEIPYNFNAAIVEAKPLVYECGPNCKCSSSCHNRVTQNGIKFQLEVFKTETRGWGVRSLNSIPSGSFICEYTGELLEDKEAEKRIGSDEYLFDIGHNRNEHTLWDGLSNLMPDSQSQASENVGDGGFTIDAAKYGSVARFINHSCSPNLYAQNVLYDHEDKRMPHIMLFAAENIPPLQELTYDYNYKIDQIRDSKGDIKIKRCFCGSSDCTGRLY